eukprot:m.220578 g.220578  ORF g.220578 m.220578 type:complete len:459 (+) comp31226_c0_seq1:232-1608(+)
MDMIRRQQLRWVVAVAAMVAWFTVGWISTPQPHRLRLVLVTLEYRYATFSGNGVYSTRQAIGLQAAGHEVLVVCGSPRTPDARDAGATDTHPPDLPIVVPSETWGSLRMDGPWEAFATGASAPSVVAAIRAFQPDAILAVDWHGAEAATRILRQLATTDGTAALTDAATAPVLRPPIVLLNYRVFSQDDDSTAAVALRDMEVRSVNAAAGVIALSYVDEAKLRALGATRTATLLPALREDVKAEAAAVDLAASERRTSLVCCVRLAPEKNALLFARVVVALASFLTQAGVAPVLCAPPKTSSNAYRQEVMALFESANVTGSRVIDAFLDPSGLAALHRRALLNFHPPTYDAYGMSVVEAAAFGTPTVLHAPRQGSPVTVGAAQLLRPDHNEVIGIDLNAGVDTVATAVRDAINRRDGLREVGRAARRRALDWDEAHNAHAVAAFVSKTLGKSEAAGRY